MKISQNTIAILKNFSRINNHILLKKGQTFHTSTPSTDILGTASVPEQFDQDLGISDLSALLQYFNIVQEPEIEFIDATRIKIKSADENNKIEIEYRLSDKDYLNVQENGMELKEVPFASFQLSAENLKKIMVSKNIGQVKGDTLKIYSQNDLVYIKVFNSENSASNSVVLEMGDQDIDKNFVMHLKTDQLNVIDADYQVKMYVRESGEMKVFFAYLTNEEIGVEYVFPSVDPKAVNELEG